MRRIAFMLMLPLLAIGLLAGCGGSSASSAASPAVTVVVDVVDGVALVDPAFADLARQLLAEIDAPDVGTQLFAGTAARSAASMCGGS